MSEIELTPAQQAIADQLDRNAAALEQCQRDNAAMDKAFVAGTFDQWVKDYRDREMQKFFTP